MTRALTIAPIILLLCTLSLSACSLPEPTRPELQKGADFPNLADVPERPGTMAPADRETMRQQLMRDNAAMGQ